MVKFAIHFLFLVTAVAHLAVRSEAFYWRTLAWFVGGLVANWRLRACSSSRWRRRPGGISTRSVLGAIGSYQRGGINVYGAVGGENVYRTNALTLDPNHLGIMLMVPLLVLLPVYLRLERGHRLRTPLALVLAFLAVVELTTLSRSGLLGLAVGLIVLAIPYGRRLLSLRAARPAARSRPASSPWSSLSERASSRPCSARAPASAGARRASISRSTSCCRR